MDEALAAYDALLGLVPRDSRAEIQAERGEVLAILQQFDAAREAFQEWADGEPKSAQARVRVGDTLVMLGRREEGEARFREALRIDPNHSAAHFALGNLSFDMGRYSRSELDYKKAVASAPDFAEAWYCLALAQYRGLKRDAAVDSCREAVRSDPNCLTYRMLLGKCLLELGRLPEAVEAYTQAAELADDDWRPLAGVAAAYYEMDDHAQAVRILLRCVRMGADDPMVYYYLGVIYNAAGDERSALAALRRLEMLRSEDSIRMARLLREQTAPDRLRRSAAPRPRPSSTCAD